MVHGLTNYNDKLTLKNQSYIIETIDVAVGARWHTNPATDTLIQKLVSEVFYPLSDIMVVCCIHPRFCVCSLTSSAVSFMLLKVLLEMVNHRTLDHDSEGSVCLSSDP